jgi:FtsH-binding integral membrane protein
MMKMFNTDYYDSQDFGTDQEFRVAKTIHVTKTMQILFLQFLFTFGCMGLSTFNPTVHAFVLSNMIPMIVIGGLGGLTMIMYMMSVSKKTGYHLALFTVYETMVVCGGSSMYGKDVVMMAMLSSLGVSVGLGVYALSSANYHHGFVGLLGSGLTCIFTMGFINFLFNIPFLHTLELYIGTLIFFGYIVFDVQCFLGERSKFSATIQEDLHIDAALNIYLDVINIFVRMSEIISKLKNDDRNQEPKRCE